LTLLKLKLESLGLGNRLKLNCSKSLSFFLKKPPSENRIPAAHGFLQKKFTQPSYAGQPIIGVVRQTIKKKQNIF
jgi:hypothetical protein